MNCIVSLALKGLHAGSRLHKVEVLKYVIVVRHYCITVVPPPLEKRRTEKQITMQTCVHYLFTILFKCLSHSVLISTTYLTVKSNVVELQISFDVNFDTLHRYSKYRICISL